MGISLPKNTRAVLAGTALAACLIPQAAFGQGRCDARQEVVSLLDQKYRETVVAAGVTNNGRLVEVFVSPDRRSWTIIVTSPEGVSCLVAAGEGWRELKLAGPET